MMLFINGLPLAMIELKNAADENATIWSAFEQFQTYKAELPSFLPSMSCSSLSDGIEGSYRHVDRRPGMVHTLADDLRVRPWPIRTCRNCR